ncbi:hypothetical protein [Pseudomonas sp. NyZ201]|uniref:hypothetical protein n=1 Tax=Pseudomonas sp. NyZ201 TaxID=3409857 RepID=UPI003CF419CF
MKKNGGGGYYFDYQITFEEPRKTFKKQHTITLGKLHVKETTESIEEHDKTCDEFIVIPS